MKSTRKLIPAIAMLVLSAVLMSTASFAWFSMNKEVSTGTLIVTANAASTNLLISSDKTSVAEIQAQGGRTAEFAPAADTLTPCAPPASVSSTNVSDPKNWWYAEGNSPTDGTAISSSITQLSTFDEYVIKESFYLTVSPGGSSITIALSNISITKDEDSNGEDLTAIKVIIVCGNHIYTADSLTADTQKDVEIATVDNSSVTQIDVYVYYDGEEEVVTSSTASTIANARISLDFAEKVTTAG